MKNKFEFFNQTNSENIRNQFCNQIDALNGEIDKLKGILEIKNQEIGSLIALNEKQRIASLNQCDLLQAEVNELKSKLANNEAIYSHECHD